MSRKVNENSLLEGLDAYGAHADELPFGPSNAIFAYRTFDLRDRFPQPFPEFRNALEALQSERAYLPEMSGEIVAYCRDGRAIEIPTDFFLVSKARFEDREAAERWIRNRMSAIGRGDRFSHVSSIALANPDDPVEKQVSDAMAYRDSGLVSPDENDRVCEQVARWLLEQLGSSC